MQRAGDNSDEWERLPTFRWAGVLTIALVWYVGATSLPQGLAWLDDRLVLHLSAAGFLVLDLLCGRLRRTGAKVATLLGMTLCAAAFIAVDLSSSGPILNIILVVQLPYVLGLRRAVVGALILNLLHFLILFEFHQRPAMDAFLSTALFACFQLFSLLIAHYAMQVSEAKNRLAATNAELLATRSLLESSARDRERLRVSRELHDVAGHMLTALKLNLRQLRDRSSGEDRAAMEDCLQMSADLLERIRSLVGNLREHDALDLGHALEELTRPFPRPEFTVEVAPDVSVNDLAVAEQLLAVAREAITNVVRHARAERCLVTVRQEDDELRLTVVDDGQGVDGRREGYGIRGMHERMDQPGASLEITPNEPSGTRVSAVWAGS